jgi:hypothetical protein
MKAAVKRHTVIGFWSSIVGWIGAMGFAHTYGSAQVGAKLSLLTYLLMIPVYIVVISLANGVGCMIGTGMLKGKARAFEAVFCFACSVAIVGLTLEFFLEIFYSQNSGFLAHLLTFFEIALLQGIIIAILTGIIIRVADIFPDLKIGEKNSEEF